MPLLTIFTPTYNAARTLPRAFDSLRAQSSHDFEWLVVDDGSSDGTRALVEAWQRVAPFPIRYHYQPNAGKHNAHNRAVSLCTTELMLILDADDELKPHAVAVISAEWNAISAEQRSHIAGIWALSERPGGALCGVPFPADRMDTTLQALRYEHRSEGERMPCYATTVLQEFPFPRTEPGACAYIPEAFVWAAITRRYRLRCINTVCRIYHPGEGLSALARREYRVSRAIVYGYAGPLANDLPWFARAPLFFLFCAVQTVRYGVYSRQLRSVARRLSIPARILLLAAAPVGLLLLARDYLSGRIARQFDDLRPTAPV